MKRSRRPCANAAVSFFVAEATKDEAEAIVDVRDEISDGRETASVVRVVITLTSFLKVV